MSDPEAVSITELHRQLDELARSRAVANPSRRDPRTSRHSNSADQIEDAMKADGHRIWGFVIYRSTYEDEAQWQEGMRRLKTSFEESLSFYKGEDLLESLAWTIIEDPEAFDNVTAAAVRQHFRQWVSEAVEEEQGVGVGIGMSMRYHFCIQIDTDSLASILSPEQPRTMFGGTAWVKFVLKDWWPFMEDPRFAKYRASPSFEPDTRVFEAVEGITERHIGWIKSTYDSLFEKYVIYRDGTLYMRLGKRPPELTPD